MDHRFLGAFMVALLASHRLPADERAVTFTFQPVAPGDCICQEVAVRTKTATTFAQSNQVISSDDRDILNQQARELVVLESDAGATAKVRVTYVKASLREGGFALARSRPQPVAGKCYVVSRIHGELQVTDVQGNVPPEEELVIVRANMQAVGRPNALAQFLHGRTVHKGERLSLPAHLVADLLGESPGAGGAGSMALTLRGIKKFGRHRCGLFDVEMLGHPATVRAATARFAGRLAIEIETCRTVLIEVQSGFDLEEERGPAGATFTVSNRGTVKIAIKATYSHSL